MFSGRLYPICLCLLLWMPFSYGQQIPASPDTVTTEPLLTSGISYALAGYRKHILQNVAYQLRFSIPREKTQLVRATEELSFTLSESSRPVWVDFKGPQGSLTGVKINGTPYAVTPEKEHILLPAALLHTGSNQVGFQFVAGNSALNRNADFCYTLLVPDRARTLFPCFDQPDIKAVYDLTLVVPSDWKVLANGALQDSTIQGDSCLYRFHTSDRLSTYLFSFVSGHFSETDRTEDGRSMHFYYRETDSARLRISMEPIFRIQANAIQFMQDYTGIAYPFQKFDFAGIPDFQFGGMEHAGAIQYKAGSLFLDSSATRDQLIGRSNLLSHETAHMWFGDLVTMRWFNDVWMKEVFANFMADKIGNLNFPDNNYDLKFLTDHFPAAYSIDRTKGSHPIRQQLDNLMDAGSLYGNIIYHKAPIMMRQLERLMGPDAFRDGLRDYLHKYAGANAGWPDLIGCLQAHTSANLTDWNQVWVNESGRPVFSYRLQTEKDKIKDLEIRQKGEEGSTRFWPQVFELALVYKDHWEQITVPMRQAVIHLTEVTGRPAPQFILFNSSGQGYGVFPADARSLNWLSNVDSTHPRVNATPLMRGAAYINLYEHTLNGQTLRPAALLAFDRKAIFHEPEELNLNLLLDQLVSVWWHFTQPAVREQQAKGLEDDLWAAMETVPASGEKKLLFRAWSNVLLTKEGTERLYHIWKEQAPPAGVRLSEDDYTNIAAALALRSYSNAQDILTEQASRIHNTDRQQRLNYLMASLSGDPKVRDSFFLSLRVAANRKKEAWVLTALSYLHHPLRGTASEKYLPASLEWLEDIQQTGDVFFPQSWLQVTFGPYQSSYAADVVRQFLQAHPDYNPKLRAKILQAADNVFRAQKLLK